MPNYVTADGIQCIFDDTDLIGEGGEAWVYKGRLKNDPAEFAFKIYKGPDAQDYQGDTPQDKLNREGAKLRLSSYGTKLKAFPKNVPHNVGTPLGLVYSRKQFRGFYTNLIPEPRETLRKYSDATFRLAGVDTNDIIKMLLNLYTTVKQCHAAGLILGDFNDLNVLGLKPYVIDAESGSFDTYKCQTYTQRFVDPLLCDRAATSMVLVKPHTASSDIYAFNLMVFQLLLLVSPYDGKYKPQDKLDWCPQDARPLHRKSILLPSVTYPKWAIKLGYTPDVLPDDLMHHFDQVLHKDYRGEFPIHLLQGMRWKRCKNCGVEHARSVCPKCATASIEKVTKVGVVTSKTLFSTKGAILHADFQNGRMLYVYYDGDKIKRESGHTLADGPPDPRLRYRVSRDNTYIAKGNTLLAFDGLHPQRKSIDTYGSLPMFDTNDSGMFWISGGRLLTNVGTGTHSERFIGNVLKNQTIFWCGSDFGFGFYRASELNEFFVFQTASGHLQDGLKVPPIKGKLLDATCEFSSSLCWFFVSYDLNGVTNNRCVVLDKHGTVLGVAENEEWFESLRGKAAVGNYLFATTDEGIVRVECTGGTVAVTRTFPDSEPFVDSNCQLFPGSNCLHVVTKNEIRSLQMS